MRHDKQRRARQAATGSARRTTIQITRHPGRSTAGRVASTSPVKAAQRSNRTAKHSFRYPTADLLALLNGLYAIRFSRSAERLHHPPVDYAQGRRHDRHIDAAHDGRTEHGGVPFDNRLQEVRQLPQRRATRSEEIVARIFAGRDVERHGPSELRGDARPPPAIASRAIWRDDSKHLHPSPPGARRMDPDSTGRITHHRRIYRGESPPLHPWIRLLGDSLSWLKKASRGPAPRSSNGRATASANPRARLVSAGRSGRSMIRVGTRALHFRRARKPMVRDRG